VPAASVNERTRGGAVSYAIRLLLFLGVVVMADNLLGVHSWHASPLIDEVEYIVLILSILLPPLLIMLGWFVERSIRERRHRIINSIAVVCYWCLFLYLLSGSLFL
jgi:hypothetical protein